MKKIKYHWKNFKLKGLAMKKIILLTILIINFFLPIFCQGVVKITLLSTENDNKKIIGKLVTQNKNKEIILDKYYTDKFNASKIEISKLFKHLKSDIIIIFNNSRIVAYEKNFFIKLLDSEIINKNVQNKKTELSSQIYNVLNDYKLINKNLYKVRVGKLLKNLQIKQNNTIIKFLEFMPEYLLLGDLSSVKTGYIETLNSQRNSLGDKILVSLKAEIFRLEKKQKFVEAALLSRIVYLFDKNFALDLFYNEFNLLSQQLNNGLASEIEVLNYLLKIDKLNEFAENFSPNDRVAFCRIVLHAMEKYSRISFFRSQYYKNSLLDKKFEAYTEKYSDILNSCLLAESDSGQQNLFFSKYFLKDYFVKFNFRYGTNISKSPKNYLLISKYAMPFIEKNFISNSKQNKKILSNRYRSFSRGDLQYINSDIEYFFKVYSGNYRKEFILDSRNNVLDKARDFNDKSYQLWSLGCSLNKRNFGCKYNSTEVKYLVNKILKSHYNLAIKDYYRKEIEEMLEYSSKKYIKPIQEAYKEFFEVELNYNIKNHKMPVNFNDLKHQKRGKIKCLNVKKNEELVTNSMFKNLFIDYLKPVIKNDKFFYLIEYNRIPVNEIRNIKLEKIKFKNSTEKQKFYYSTRLIKVNIKTGKIIYGKEYLVPKQLYFLDGYNYNFFNGQYLVALSKEGFVYYNLNMDEIYIDNYKTKVKYYDYSLIKKGNDIYIFYSFPAPQKLLVYNLITKEYKEIYTQQASKKFPLKGYKEHLFLEGETSDNNKLLFKRLYSGKYLTFDFQTNSFKNSKSEKIKSRFETEIFRYE